MKGLLVLGASMFRESGLTSVLIPSTITTIGSIIIIFIVLLLDATISDAFYLCASLTSVELMNGLLGLGLNMFRESGLTSVLIPSTITSIGLIIIILIVLLFYDN